MSSNSDDSINSRAQQACVSCRKQKRKCDKALPACSLCCRLNRACDYRDPSASTGSDDLAELRQKIQDLEGRLDTRNGTPASPSYQGLGLPSHNAFPAMFFLDSEVFQYAHLSIPRPVITVPEEVLALLKEDDLGAVAESFFSTIHKWLPIVSRKRLFLTLSSPTAQPGADLALLFLCMRLIMHVPIDGTSSAQNTLYWTAKSFFTMVESSALMSIQLIQSALLLAAYEVFHGIYPAAFLSTGHCGRLINAFGLHDRKGVPQMMKRLGSWAEQEEVRRVWWGTLLLDR